MELPPPLREIISESFSDLEKRISENYKMTSPYLRNINNVVEKVYSGHIPVSLGGVLQKDSEFWGMINELRGIGRKKVVSEILFDTSEDEHSEDEYITHNLFLPIKHQDLKTQTRLQLSDRYDKVTESFSVKKTVHLMEDWFHSRERVFTEINRNNYQVTPAKDDFLLLQVTIPKSQRISEDDFIERLKKEQPSYFEDINLHIDTIYYHDWLKDSIRKPHPRKRYTTREASRMTGVSVVQIHKFYRSKKRSIEGTDFIKTPTNKKEKYLVLQPGIEKIKSLYKR